MKTGLAMFWWLSGIAVGMLVMFARAPSPTPVIVNVTDECRAVTRQLADQQTAVSDVLMLHAERQTAILEWVAARNNYSPDGVEREEIDKAVDEARARMAPLNPYGAL